MLTSSCKNKGRALQKRIRDKILETFKSLEPDDCRSIGMGQQGCDIQLSPAAKKLFNFAVEAKNQEKISIWSCLKQAESNAKGDMVPLLVFSKNRSKTYVALEFDQFMKIISEK